MKIERGVPLPTRQAANKKYDFTKMKVNDSFFVRCSTKALTSRRQTIWYAMIKFWHDNPKTLFTIRKVDGGLRCWRLK